MKKDFENDFGYDYIMALCSAIEEVIRQEEVKNPDIFTYKGSNLRYAITRALYFSYVNHDQLFEIYIQSKKETLISVIKVKDDIEKKLITTMCNVREDKIIIEPRAEMIEQIKTMIKPSVRFCIKIFLLDKIATLIRKKINFFQQKNSTCSVLFFTINERFVQYMKPIFDKMPVSCQFITHNPVTANYLNQEKIPFVKISSFLYSIKRWSQKDSWIKRFYLTEQYDLLEDSILRIYPKSIVFVEGNAPQYEVVNRICKKFGIQSVCVQQGWAPIVNNGFRNMSYSKMLVWGEGFAKDLAPYNTNQHFTVTGNFMVETKPPKDIKKIKTIALFSHGKTRIVPSKTLKDFVDFARQLANKYQSINIIIREHPVYKLDQKTKSELEKCDNVMFMSEPKYSLESIMEKSNINITVFSTVSLESLSAGILPIIINTTSCPKFFPDIDKMKAGIEVKTTNEALQTVEMLIRDPKEFNKFKEPMKKFRKEYFAYDKETAMKNIIKEIIN